MQNVTIRNATSEDVESIQVIYAYHVLNGLGTFEEVPPLKEDMQERLNSIASAGYPYLVAEYAGVVVGYCYVSRYRPRSSYRFTVEDSVYIAKDFQGKNIGYMLLEVLIAKCKELQLKQILAFIGDSSNSSSINLHKKHGFVYNGTLKKVGFKFDRWVDVVIMQLELPDTHDIFGQSRF